MLSAREASARIMREIRALPAERVATTEAVGRFLAEPVAATVTIPPWSNASMDGYAVQATDVAGAVGGKKVRLPVVADIPAGRFAPRALGRGEAMRIMTGAPVPEGADSVIRIEDTDGGREQVEIRDSRDARRNVRRAGEDFAAGDLLAAAGTEITPALLGVLMSSGITEVAAHRRPRVAILSSGDELVMADRFDEVRAGKRIVSSNSYTLAALVRDAGGIPIDLGIAADTAESLTEKLAGAKDADFIITSAGVSVGDADHTRDVFAALGGEQHFWKVRIRPGAPMAFGTLAGVPWLGLSGNPVSAVVTFEIFARAAMRKMLGAREFFRRPLRVTLEDDVSISADLVHFLRARVRRDGEMLRARLTRSQSSASLSSLAAANALLVVPPDKREYSAGSAMSALPLEEYPFELEELEL